MTPLKPFVAVLLLIPWFASAQNILLQLSAGPSFATGAFAQPSGTVDRVLAGGTRGYQAQTEFTAKIWRGLSFSAAVMIQNIDASNSRFRGVAFKSENVTHVESMQIYCNTAYENRFLGAGLSYRVKLGQHFLRTGFLYGSSTSRPPSGTFLITGNNDANVFTTEQGNFVGSSTVNQAWIAHLDYFHNISKKFMLKGSLNYFYSNSRTSLNDASAEVRYRTLALNLGICFKMDAGE